MKASQSKFRGAGDAPVRRQIHRDGSRWLAAGAAGLKHRQQKPTQASQRVITVPS